MQQEVHISIIGFGNIGKFITGLLLPNKDFHFRINVVDTDWQVHGAVLDMKHGSELFPHHALTYNDENLLQQSDFIFHCAGASVPRGESRLSTCEASASISEAIFESFQPKKEPFIIVVANPVEIITYLTQKLTGLPKNKVIGTGTMLDSLRMDYVLKETHNHVNSANAVLLGEHGTTTFISRQLSRVNGKPIADVFKEDSMEELMITVKASASEIKETQKATIYGVGYCAIKLFEAIIYNQNRHFAVSTAIDPPEDWNFKRKPLCLSLPCIINEAGASLQPNYTPNEQELSLFKRSAKLIKSGIPKRFR